MKSLFAALLAAVMVLSFAACSSDDNKKDTSETTSANEQTETTQEEAVEEVPDEEAPAESEEAPADETAPDAESSDEETSSEDAASAEEQVITGTITASEPSNVTIQTEDGTTLSFSIPDEADQSGVNGMTVGDTLEITYTGSIDGEDTSAATVVKLVQTPAETTAQQ